MTTTEDARPAHPNREIAPIRRRLPRWASTLLHNPASLTGIFLVALFIAVALGASTLAPPANPAEPYRIPRTGFQAEPQPPGSTHLFGTTQGQYDLYYGVVWGTRTAFQVGLVITFLTVLVGGAVGGISGYVGGWLDEIVQRVVEVVFAFPFLLAAVTLATVLRPKLGNGLLVTMIALVAFGWPGYARLLRGDVLAVKGRDYVLAARVVGVPGWRILLWHVLPNAMYSLLVVASLDIGTNVLSFAALSFLGLGAAPGYADWGQLLNFARSWIPNLSRYWYTVVFPGGALLLFVLGWNLIGDAFRDALDPKLAGTGRGK